MSARAVLSLIAVVALGGLASADPKADAQVHIDNASKLHGEGKLAEALQELKDAYVLDPRPELLFAIGQIHVNLGQCTEAITYYERFLGTKPDGDAAAVTREAIDTCKKNPPPVKPKKDEPKKDEPKKVEPPPVVVPEAPQPWYSDVVADGLLGGGLVVGIAGGILYGKARSDRSKADDITSFEKYADKIDHAKSERTVSVVLGVAGGALMIGGVVRLLTHDRVSGIAVTPAPGGGAAVSWTRGF